MMGQRPGHRDTWRQIAQVSCDVVVVGSGAAGMNAAIHAAMDGASTVILDKGSVGRSGASVQANVSTSAAPEGRWESHAADIVRTGAGLADEDLAEALARDALPRLREWHEWGVRFRTDGNGDFVRTLSRGHSEPRAISPGYGMGEKACRVLRKRLLHEPAIRALPYTSAVEVVLHDGEVHGVLAWSYQDSTWVVVDAPSVVLATGGAQQLYPASTTTAQLTGDGYAMAAAAGAPLVDLEFTLFVPVCLVAPRPIAISRTVLEPVRKISGRLLDRAGRSFADDYAPAGAQEPWEVLSRVIELAARDGRAEDDGTVRFVADPDEQAAMADVFPTIVTKLPKAGIDLGAGVHVRPMAHFFPGGVKIDRHAESAVPGLFAAGEAAGGVHGATRLGGDAFSAAAVFGARAGRYGSRRARRVTTASDHVVAYARQAIERAVGEVDGRTGAPPAERIGEIQRIVGNALGPVRRREELDAAATVLGGAPLRWRLDRPDPVANREFVTSLEARSLELAARALLAAARSRQENKGSHYLMDDPASDDVSLSATGAAR
jgi:succinate dehydrogenase / fumarate reductase flavoprotein subunit